MNGLWPYKFTSAVSGWEVECSTGKRILFLVRQEIGNGVGFTVSRRPKAPENVNKLTVSWFGKVER